MIYGILNIGCDIMQEPLLKDEEEKLVVAPDNKLVPTKKHKEKKEKKPFKWDRNIIITIILAIFILWFFGRNIIKPFYMGFKYYDLRFEDNTSENNNANEDLTEEEIPNNSDILNTTYNKIYIDNCTNTSVIRNRIYSNTLVNNLDNVEKMIAVLNYYNYYTDVNNHDIFTISLSEVNRLGIYLFNDISFITTANTIYGNYQVTYDDVNQLFNVNIVNSNICEETFNREFLRATTLNDELYIYETVNNINYKWTFKKGNDNNYYFVSITPE